MELIPAPATLMQLFVTEIYRTELADTSADPLLTRLDTACRRIAATDAAGQDWSREHGYLGYTSYASIDNLTDRDQAFTDLKRLLDAQIAVYAGLIELDLRRKTPQLAGFWINALDPLGAHSGHIHPNSAFSGTLYIDVPEGSGALQFEDPRMSRMMCAPPRFTNAQLFRRTGLGVEPRRGTLLLWESWLRHEVALNRATGTRLSLSFNYTV